MGSPPRGMSDVIPLDARRRELRGRGGAVTWLGHATALIELDGVRVITDPALGRRIGPLVRLTPVPDDAKAERLDAVLLSHLHHDHADLPSLRRFGDSTPVIVPRGAGRWLEARG